MRKAINENPRVQLAVIAVFGVLFAIMLYTMVLSGSDVEPEPSRIASPSDGATPPAPTPSATAPAAPAAPEPAVPATPESTAPVPTPPPAGDEGLAPSKGLPQKVLVPLAKGKAVALLVVDPKAISDRQVKVFTKRLASHDDVAVVNVKVGEIARYSRITQGVSVSRTPALVVIAPRDGSGRLSGTVRYGFRGAKSIEVALEDALYEGGVRSASP